MLNRRTKLSRSSSSLGNIMSPINTDEMDTGSGTSSGPSSGHNSARSTLEIDVENDEQFRPLHNLLRSSSNSHLFASDFSLRNRKSRSMGQLPGLHDSYHEFVEVRNMDEDDDEVAELKTVPFSPIDSEPQTPMRGRFISESEDDRSPLPSPLHSACSMPDTQLHQNIHQFHQHTLHNHYQHNVSENDHNATNARLFQSTGTLAAPKHVRVFDPRRHHSTSSRPSSLDKDGKVVKRTMTEVDLTQSFNNI